MQDLDRVALVTGASRGIGWAIASTLARAGFPVALTARNKDQLAKNCAELNRFGRAMAVAADLTDPEAPKRVLDTIAQELGHPHVLINNAGTAPSDRFENTQDSDLDAVFTLHVKTPFRFIRQLLPEMKKREGSCIVQLASTAGLIGFPFTSAYTAAKHGMVGMTRALAAELGDRSPRVYALCPGFVDTEITQNAAAAVAARGKQTIEEAQRALGAMNKIGRMHTAQEVADAVLQLVSERPAGCVYNLDQTPPGFV